MAGKFCVSLTHSLDDPDRATVAFVVASAAVASDQETMVFLSTEGVRLGIAGAADAIHEEGFQPLKDLIAGFVEAGGSILVCAPCFKKRGLDSGKLIPGAAIVGGARLVEFLSQGAPCVSY
jgi:predicted peroxiredoxin